MSRRRFAPLALTLGALACQPSIPGLADNKPAQPPATVAYAVSVPSPTDGTASISPPVPNDLILQNVAAVPAGAQKALLAAFAQGGGWPNDQEVPLVIQFIQVKSDASGAPPTATAAPAIDTTTITPSTLAVVRLDTGTPQLVDFEVASGDYVTNGGLGTLTIHRKTDAATGSRWWPTSANGGRYVVALRGGDQGVKTKDGQPIAAQTATYLIAQDQDLTNPQNQGLLKSYPNPAAVGAQLEQLRLLYANPTAWTNTPGGWLPAGNAAAIGLKTSAFAGVDLAFPHKEIASIQTFVVDPNPHVAVDPGAGIVPLPSEFLMDANYYANPPAAKVQNVPALCKGVYDQQGPPPSCPLSRAIAGLDGFSTTGMLMAPTSGLPLLATKVTPSSAILLRLNGSTWEKVAAFNPADGSGSYVNLPPPITVDPATGKPCSVPYGSTCLAKLVGLQPAVSVGPVPSVGYLPLPPLQEKTKYAVLLTSDLLDAAGHPLTPGTLSKILKIAADPNTPVYKNGKSQLSGVPDATAAQLQQLSAILPAELQAVVTGAVGSGAVDPATAAKVVFGYTFPTATVRTSTLGLAGLPAGISLPTALAGAPTTLTPAEAGKKYGVNPAFLAGVDHFLDATMITWDLLDPATGAFKPNPASGTATPIPLLVAVPATAGARPLAVFHHGLTRGRADLLAIAGALTQGGFVVAAIDTDKHGDRTWCSSNADCASGKTCQADPALANQGDAPGPTPGHCQDNAYAYNPVQSGIPACSGTVTTNCWDGTGGVAKASGNYFISGNLFRSRDSLRQDVIDEEAMVRAVRAEVSALGITLDATPTAYVGQSLGAIQGTVNLAADSALGAGASFGRAVLNVDGATAADILTTAPAFQQKTAALLASLGIQPGTAGYLQFLYLAKWILDPADPSNFAAMLVGKPILGQAALCDQVVPNPQNALLYGLMGLQPGGVGNPVSPTASAANPSLQWYMLSNGGVCPADAVSHGFLLDPGTTAQTQSLTQKAQGDVAKFLLGAPVTSNPVTP